MRAAIARQDEEKAAQYAAMAAPYCHPRMQSVQHSTPLGEPVQITVKWKGE